MLRVIHGDLVLLEIEEQVVSATLRTNRGSAPPTFLDATTGVIELVIEKVPAGGPLRLDQLEAAQLLATQKRGTEGETVGMSDTALEGDAARILNTPQGANFDTLGKGASDDNEKPSIAPMLTEDLTKGLDESGIEVVESITYDPAAQTFDAEIEKIAAADPEAIVVIGFDESSRVLAAMIEAGIGPSDKLVYGCDGNMGNALGENFEAGK